MNILLASVIHLPEMINGKVCVIIDDKKILLRPSKGTEISDNFDPMEYSILIHEKYNKCIVYSTEKERVDYIIKQRYKHLYREPERFRVGDRIHIYSRAGIYEVVSTVLDTIEITCGKWQRTPYKTMVIKKSDFRALAGGLNNYAE